MQTSQSTGFAWSCTSLSFVIEYHFLLLGTSLSYKEWQAWKMKGEMLRGQMEKTA